MSFAGTQKRPSSASTTDAEGRKRPRKDEEPEAGPSNGAKPGEPKTKPTRGSRACTVCRRLKMKCVGAEQGPPCKRCQAGNHECVFEESNRGKRSSKKHEILTRSLRKMERTLDTVLKSIGNPSIVSGMISRSPSPSAQLDATQALMSQTESPSPTYYQHRSQNPPSSPKLHSLPDNSLNPLGLLAEASLANRRAQVAHPAQPSPGSGGDPPKAMGVASDAYFKPGPMNILPLRRLFIERQIQPEMLTFVSTEEVVALFDIYFNQLNMHCNLLDRDFHTPSLVCSRSPFLLTTVCAVSSKFYTQRPELHGKLTDLSKKLAFNVPAQGYKSVEIVQAYLILAMWGCGPVERYEQDKTWMLLGMAIRMAVDLNLHRKTAVAVPETEAGKARDKEVHNRERTWLLCFCLDRSVGAQMGKPFSIKEDAIIRNALSWIQSPLATKGDFALAAYVELQRIVSRSLEQLYSDTDTPSGLLVHCDYLLVIKTMERQIQGWYAQIWEGDIHRGSASSDPADQYASMMSSFYANYAMLVINSFGLQNALERSPVNKQHFFTRVHTCAKTCAIIIRDELGPRNYLRFSPDSHFVFGSYAVLSLLKLMRPEFLSSPENEPDTISLVKAVADTFDNVAAGPTHTPALYAIFLRALISARTDPEAQPQQQQQQQQQSLDQSHGHNSHNRASNNNMHDSELANGLGFGGGNQGGSAHGESTFTLPDFQFTGEMGPVADLSVFPPTMASRSPTDGELAGLSMDHILSGGFWDNVLVPGYANPMEGLSGGFVYGAGGSGFITPSMGLSPAASGQNSPSRLSSGPMSEITQHGLNAAFQTSPSS